MFFSPTVLALTKPELGNHVKILCLSSGTSSHQLLSPSNPTSLTKFSGDADGLGHIRKKELQQSAKHLGLRADSDVFIVDDPNRFPDSMTATWSESDISSLLASAFAPDLASQSQPQSSAARKRGAGTTAPAPTASIDVLVTFDKHGISNHPNHRSLYHGAVHFLRALMKDKAGYTCPVTLYTLTTTNILRKYIGVLDAPLTMASGALGSIFAGGGVAKGGKKDDMPGKLLFISSVDEYVRAQAAMVKAHKSQMVWFRYGWITLGRYMVVNDLRRVRV
jgi:N-acetylglucosaminylphosphatidylinositol deacetylase